MASSSGTHLTSVVKKLQAKIVTLVIFLLFGLLEAKLPREL